MARAIPNQTSESIARKLAILWVCDLYLGVKDFDRLYAEIAQEIEQLEDQKKLNAEIAATEASLRRPL
jgi:hypothetical protein